MEVTSRANEVSNERCILAGGQQSGRTEGTCATSIHKRKDGTNSGVSSLVDDRIHSHVMDRWTHGSVTASENP